MLDASAQDEIDITSTDVLIGLIKTLRAKGIEWYVADVHAPVLERGRETGLARRDRAGLRLPDARRGGETRREAERSLTCHQKTQTRMLSD